MTNDMPRPDKVNDGAHFDRRVKASVALDVYTPQAIAKALELGIEKLQKISSVDLATLEMVILYGELLIEANEANVRSQLKLPKLT